MQRFLLGVLILAIIGCIGVFLLQFDTTSENESLTLVQNIPNDAVLIIESKDFPSFQEALLDQPHLNRLVLDSNLFNSNILSKLTAGSGTTMPPVPGTFSVHQIGKENFGTLIQLHDPKSRILNYVLDSCLGNSVELNYENEVFWEGKVNQQKYYVLIDKKVLAITNELNLIKSYCRWNQAGIKKSDLPENGLTLRATRSKTSLGQLYLNPSNYQAYLNSNSKLSGFGPELLAELCLDFSIGAQHFRLNGIASPMVNNPAFSSMGAESSIPIILDKIPADLISLERLTLGKSNTKTEEIQKIGRIIYRIERNNGTALAIPVSLSKLSTEFNNAINKTGVFNLPPALNSYESFLPGNPKSVFGLYLNEVLYIGENKPMLNNISQEVRGADSFENSTAYQLLASQVNFNSSYFKVNLTNPTKNVFDHGVGLSISLFSYLKEDKFYLEVYHTQMGAANTDAKIWSVAQEGNLRFPPSFVENHYTHENEILLINEENAVFLHNKNGRRLWKKQLRNSVLRTPIQLDFYKNGKLQLGFNTNQTIELIDRNGRDVEGYPINLKTKITSPMLVTDYDLNHDYRYIFACGRTLKNLDKEGAATKGWEAFVAQDTIASKPRYIKIGTKDYLIVEDISGSVYVLNRRGSIRYETHLNIGDAQSLVFFKKGNTISSCSYTYVNYQDKWVNAYLNGKKEVFDLPGISNISQVVAMGKNGAEQWALLSGEDVFILNDQLQVIKTINGVEFPLIATQNDAYPVIYNSITEGKSFCLSSNLKKYELATEPIRQGIVGKFNSSGKTYALGYSDQKTNCYQVFNKK